MGVLDGLTLEREAEPALYRQLSDAIRERIENGTLPPGVKLPPIRVLARQLGINGTTVVSAYKELESHKLVFSQIGSGTYVKSPSGSTLPAPILKNLYSAPYQVSGSLAGLINFADTSTDASFFPIEAFKRAFDAVLERDGGSAFDYQDSQGYEPLRDALRAYAEKFYAIKTAAEQIQIISGAQQGLDILAKALLEPGDAVLTEQPTFYGAAGAFITRGARLYGMPLEPDGPDMRRAEAMMRQYRPKCVYVMPNFQTPAGISYSPEKKRKLLELAYQYDSYIIEEDNQNDFYYSGKRPVPLKALDYRSRVIFVKSFSKILMPGLRMGFMALPKKLAVTTVKRNTDIATSGYIQRAFDWYLRAGRLAAHGDYIRDIYGKRYKMTINAIERYLSPYVTFNAPEGGLSVWLEVRSPGWSHKLELFYAAVLKRGVIITPGNIFSDMADGAFRVSFASVSEEHIAAGIEIIASAMKEV